ncbi:LptE family protein [uncultured Polaribacter sp.]|uniref:LptE family protein n=1 Tax=uncultured Polaribacter sp. TaxID=174711 RepID=UPI0026170827|nr:LptE family protein [uncultured Polaribacter sp.]
MKKIIFTTLISITALLFIACGAYSFTGGSTGNAKTLQVDFFPNEAALIEPTLSQRFTQDMLDLFTRQTNLTTVSSNGDLYFSGEITGYRINPMSATAQQTAAQNRLTITVNVRFENKLIEKDNFEKQFSFYSDFDGSAQLTGSILEAALDEILERITQDVFNASVAKW